MCDGACSARGLRCRQREEALELTIRRKLKYIDKGDGIERLLWWFALAVVPTKQDVNIATGLNLGPPQVSRSLASAYTSLERVS